MTSLTSGASTDACWTDERDRVLVGRGRRAARRAATSTTPCGRGSPRALDDAQVLDLLVLCGFYHAVSYLANVARLEPEPFAAR